MSKIICDLCGSTFPEDADRCPVCGTAKTEAPVQQEEKPAARRRRPQKKSFGQKMKDGWLFVVESARANLGLAIAVLLLVLAIIAVCIFIAVSLNDQKNPGRTDSSSSSSSSSSTSATVPCAGISLPDTQINILLTADASVFVLTPDVSPAGTTDKVTYSSSNDTVATVDDYGTVTAVADGQAVITITCGGFSTTCTVLCDLKVIPPEEPLKLNREEFTLSKGAGFTWNLADRLYGYTGPDAEEVTWSSADETIATVENGKVTAVGNGNTIITAKYKDQTVTCKVICADMEPSTEEKYEWNHPGYNGVPDVTVNPGWTYKLQLINKETGEAVDVVLKVKDETVCIINEDGKVEALENTSGKTRVTTITAEIDGEVYKFTIRVKPTAPADET